MWVRHIDALREVVSQVQTRHLCVIHAWVVLPEHLHCVIELLDGDSDSSAHQPGCWQYNADNQLIQWGQGAEETKLTYTPNGHTETETKGNTTKTYRYNASDRLIEVQANGPNHKSLWLAA